MEKKHSYSVYIVDLMMPVMDGATFITQLKTIHPDAVILVQTALDSSETIINIMKMGVYDYIIKPIDPVMFETTLKKALEFSYLKNLEKEQSQNAGKKIRSQIEWLNYKESRRLSSKDSAETKSIYSLKTSLAQGAGFGSLITIIDLLQLSMKETDDGVMVDKELIKMLIENNEHCRSQIEGLYVATDLMDRDYPLEDSDAASLVAALPAMTARVAEIFPQKKLALTFPELKENCKLKINKEILDIVVDELLSNAFKYALTGTTVNIFVHVSEGYFWLSFKNDVPEHPLYGGVPAEFEKLVLEPFFRLNPPDESLAKIEKISFGLGLAVIDYAAKKHHGMFIIHDVTDFTSDRPRPCTIAEFLLPIAHAE
jgi:signal transduction histidine kinase